MPPFFKSDRTPSCSLTFFSISSTSYLPHTCTPPPSNQTIHSKPSTTPTATHQQTYIPTLTHTSTHTPTLTHHINLQQSNPATIHPHISSSLTSTHGSHPKSRALVCFQQAGFLQINAPTTERLQVSGRVLGLVNVLPGLGWG
jgi:hypothetical protein